MKHLSATWLRPALFFAVLLASAALLPSPASAEAPAQAPEPIVKPAAPPRFVADLSLDVQANMYAFARKQTGFALELSPRFGILIADFLDFGLNFIAGYGGAMHSWSQATMFGVGPYVGTRLPLSAHWRFVPWVAVLYHQTFLDGFTPGPDTGTSAGEDVAALRQIVRVDMHLDVVFHPASRTGFSIGGFAKTRAASFDSGLGQAHEVDAGVRIGAVSYF